MRFTLPAQMAAAIAGTVVLCLGLNAALASGATQGVQQSRPYGLNINDDSVQWVRMPAPYPGANPVWCVVANGDDGGGGSGVGITCDWGQNSNGYGGETTP